MFIEYLENLRATGKRYFTFQEVIQDLGLSEDSAKSGMYRLKKAGKVISPFKGLYVIVPPEHRPYGSIPAEDLVPIMMKHLGAQYYVGLLTAAAYYGAEHQKTFKFQVITNHRIPPSMRFGQVELQFIHKKSLENLPIQKFVVNTGYLKVASPELVALDLLNYLRQSGGMDHIATVYSELIEVLNADKLIRLAENIHEPYQLQRIGYIIENIDVVEEGKKEVFINVLENYLKGNMKSYVPLAPNIDKVGYPRCKRWKIIENTDIESDL